MTIQNKFKIGDNVVYVRVNNLFASHLYPVQPIVGETYTVRGTFNPADTAGIYLEEIRGLVRQPWGDQEQSIREDRFVLASEYQS
jgi:hypothetical protein